MLGTHAESFISDAKEINDFLSQSTAEVNISKYSFPILTLLNLSYFLLKHPPNPFSFSDSSVNFQINVRANVITVVKTCFSVLERRMLRKM